MPLSSKKRGDLQVRTYDRATSVVFAKTNEAFGGLSNMARGFPLLVNGMRIFTSEALYQACRFPHRPDLQRLIIGQASPMSAKMRGKPYRRDSRPDWDRVRVKIMRWCLRVKLAQNWERFRWLLLETGDRPIVEESSRDDFWGAKPIDEHTLVGKNVLGRLLMELREAVKAEDRGSPLWVEPLDITNFMLAGRPIETIHGGPEEGHEVMAASGEQHQSAATSSTQVAFFDQLVIMDPEAKCSSFEGDTPGEIRKFKSYPAYKDSGVEWLGEVPAHWQIRRLKTIASVQLSNIDKKSVEGQDSVRLCNYVDVYYNERISNDMEFMAATATPEQVRRFSLRAGDVLITKDSESWTDIAVSAVVAEDLPGVLCGYHLALIRPSLADLDGSFLARVCAAIGPRDQFQIAANGITRFGLAGDAIRTALFGVPPISEQQTIAAFLDRETAKIDELLAKKERLIDLLQEKRTALITRAVTKGLDSNVPMKDSGLEWLGEIPAHWEVKKVKHLAGVLRGKFTHRPRNDPKMYDGPFPFIQTGDIAGARKYVAHYHQTLTEDGYRVSKEFPAGTLVMTIAANVGDMAILSFRACFPDSIVGFVPRDRVGLDYLYYNMTAMREELQKTSTINTQFNLNLDRIGSIWTVLPPEHEQYLIVNTIELGTAQLDTLTSKVREGIERLREYRAALISAAVTGKIDVRGQAA